MFWDRFLCRFCATIGATSYPIFEKPPTRDLETKIKRCLNLNVFEDDLKPKSICVSCYAKLNEINEFIELCYSANSKFEHILYHSERTSEVLNDSYAERPVVNPAQISLVIDDASCVIMAPKNEFLAIENEEYIAQQTFHHKSYNTKHNYGDDVYQQKYDEKLTVLRHSSQFQRMKSCEENDIVHSNIILPGDYSIQNDRIENYEYKNNEYEVISVRQVTPIEEQPSETNIGDIPAKTILDNTLQPNLIINNVENIGETPPKNQNKKKINLISVQKIITSMKEEPTKQISALNRTKECSKPVKTNERDRNKRYTCSECKKTFTRKFNLSAHILRHANNKPFSCEMCEKSFVLRSDLTSHKHVHSSLYKCKVCSKGFSVPSKLERHLRIHTNERIFSCTVENCGKSFTDKRNLNGHMVVHSDARNFGCDICKKTFKTKHQLNDHFKMHSDTLSFKCQVCSSAYKWKTNLLLHMKKHNANGYNCRKCNKNCLKLSNLLKHRKECTGTQ